MNYWDTETINKIRKGFYSAVYFNRTKHILLEEKDLQTVTMQIFQKQEGIVCGIDQVLSLFKEATGYFEKNKWVDKSESITIDSLLDGDTIKSGETIMHIMGPYAYFAHLESLFLGILARQTKIATNTSFVVKAAKKKSVIFFADRFDYFLNQEIDGYAAKIGGATGVATEAQAFLWQGKPMGTIPHALIASNNGDTIKSAKNFAKYFPQVPLIVLADFDNDCVKTSLAVAKEFGDKLFAVRLDTSETNIDKSLEKTNFADRYGVNIHLVKNVREALDKEGFNQVKIVVSGGFNEKKVSVFEKKNIPVDIYGIGSSLLKNNIDFTADIVKIDDKFLAKIGRKYRANNNLCRKVI